MSKGPITISVSILTAAVGICVTFVMLVAPSAAAVVEPQVATEHQEAPDRVPRIEIALLPNGTGIEWLGRMDGLSPGLLSPGMARVLPDQTYLDIGQGARVFNSLYDRPIPLVYPRGDRVPRWDDIRSRAASAPGSIRPGLFASTVNGMLAARHGIRDAVRLAPELVVPALLGADERGRIARQFEACVTRRCRPPVLVRDVRPLDLPRMVAQLERRDLLIAFERPPADGGEPLAVAVAGRGFEGSLTSDSTRTDGYVLSTDIAPTVLERLGIEIPPAMSGRPIVGGGDLDARALAGLADRMSVVAPRRGPVLGVAVMVWLALTALGVMFVRTRRLALRLLALTAIYAPFVLLATAWLEPSLGAERALLVAGAPLLAAFTARVLGPWRDIAVGCAVTVGAHAADMLAGSPLTALSLIGPNPALGVRFYGIGNELGSTLTMLILLGTGAGLAGFAPGLDRRRAAAVFLAVALPLAFVFAAGRFGAGVGSALVIPAAALVAAALMLARPRLAVLAAAAPALAVAALVALDSLTGGNSHFQRTVLEADGIGDLLDTATRRLQLTGRSFVRAASGPFLPLTVLVVGLAVAYRDRVREWVTAAPPGFAAAFGAGIFATLLGTAANDSGVLLLQVGTAYLLVLTGYAWAER